jgi:hypothetical protein
MREAEIYLLLSFFLTGSLLGILFDTRGVLRSRRRAPLWEAASDLLYGFLAALLVGSAVVLFAGGSLRASPLAALAFGFWLERRLFSPAFRPWWRKASRRMAGWWQRWGRMWPGWPKKRA